jgi:hypothetical protein
MKSAYELALERLDSQGIERPGEIAEETRRRIAAERSKAEAELAKLEILHRQHLREAADAASVARAEEEYAIDRRRIEDRLEAAIARLRGGG